jgi:hypothetical protein
MYKTYLVEKIVINLKFKAKNEELECSPQRSTDPQKGKVVSVLN